MQQYDLNIKTASILHAHYIRQEALEVTIRRNIGRVVGGVKRHYIAPIFRL